MLSMHAELVTLLCYIFSPCLLWMKIVHILAENVNYTSFIHFIRREVPVE